ncbi:YozE family protein [Lacticaseibacillus zhaodongensis]|uniref:YozE family protein n=1 Tax=Lacticaseibacillus zhaodongensis TaxID=2668065 RepID=UPI0012D30104|nr:YozE family protein [Lacticaseibacillus zhaodongensis]
MNEPFYRYLMTLRNPNDHGEVANFAQNAFLDHAFPKQSYDYHELANYLELNGSYLPNMDVFDQAFQMYRDARGDQN